MKQKNVFFLSALLAAAGLQAQAQIGPQHPRLHLRHPLDPITQGILQRQAPQPAQRGTGATDRLIGWRIDYGDGSADSARYKYNGNARGSDLDNNVLNTYLERGYYPYSDNNAQVRPYPLVVSRNAPSVKYDTANFQTLRQDTVRNKANVARVYTGNTLSREYQRTDDAYPGRHVLTNSRTDLAYDPARNILKLAIYYDTSLTLSGDFALTTLYNYRYDAGRITKDSCTLYPYPAGVATPSLMVDYTYDAAGNLSQAIETNSTSGALAADNKETYLYANGKLYVHLSQHTDDAGATWKNKVVDTFRYQGNNLTYNSSYSWDDASAGWATGYLTVSYYNAQNNVDSQIGSKVANGIVTPDTKAVCTYNAYGHYTRIAFYDHNGTGYDATASAGYDMYYETFTPSAIGRVVKEQDLASLYPNPAKETLHVRMKAAGLRNADLRIFNALGQLVQQSAVSGDAQLSIGRLAPGAYVLEVTAGEAVQRLKFVKD